MHLIVVMAGLVPAIHVFSGGNKHVDARDKPAHDDNHVRVERTLATKFAEPDSRETSPAMTIGETARTKDDGGRCEGSDDR